jgi:DNA-binding response OmpR family regulator
MTKVLIADDSIAVRKVAERLLTEAGFGVALAANGEEALAYLAKETPDLVVSDVIMPDKSGYEVCAFVRAQRALANTPVLLISGIVNDEVTKQAESCHADGVLKKPFQGTSLKDRVLELLAKRQSTASPAMKSIEKVTASSEPTQSSHVRDEQGEIYRHAMARLQPLEEELRVEPDRLRHSAQRVSQPEGQLGRVEELESMLAREQEQTAQLKTQLAGQLGRVGEFESMLAREQEQTAQLKTQLATAENAIAQVHDLESALKAERERTAEAKNQASLAESLGGRVRELEAALEKERDDSAQQARYVTELQKNASHTQELEAALQAERQAATQLVEQMTGMEQAVIQSQVLAQQLEQEQKRASDLTRRAAESEQLSAQVSMLEQALAAEQQRNSELAGRLSIAERASAKGLEGDTLLQTERERNRLLVKRVSEAEQTAEQASKRFEEMARKLGEIAGLASQLGNGKRLS